MKENHIYYISYDRFPSEKAAAKAAAQTVFSLKKNGAEISLLVPRRLGRIKEDVCDYYDLPKNCFRTIYIPVIDLIYFFSHSITFHLGVLIYTFSLLVYLLFFGKKKSIIYTRIQATAFVLSFFYKKIIFETHQFPEKKSLFYRILFRRVSYISTCSGWQAENLEKKFAIPREKIILARSAIDLSTYNNPLSRQEARVKLNLPTNKKIVLYTGNLFKWKGVDTLALATEKLDSDTEVYIVGGSSKSVSDFGNKYKQIKNLKLIGHRPSKEMPNWQWAADVLVIPNTAKEKVSLYYTSPMKLFEYMATGTTPMIVSDIPSITEVANEKNAILTEPDSIESLASSIDQVLSGDYSERAARAFQDVQQYTWDNRAQLILDKIFSTTD